MHELIRRMSISADRYCLKCAALLPSTWNIFLLCTPSVRVYWALGPKCKYQGTTINYPKLALLLCIYANRRNLEGTRNWSEITNVFRQHIFLNSLAYFFFFKLNSFDYLPHASRGPNQHIIAAQAGLSSADNFACLISSVTI